MSLDLDTRQRAMLHEMGVHVWLPDATDSEATSTDNTRARGINRSQEPEAKASPSALPVAPPLGVSVAAAPEASASAVPPQVSPVVEHRPVRADSPRGAVPSRVTALPPGIDHMDWPQLQATLAACQACAMCLGRRASVLDAPSMLVPCDWLVVGDPPDETEERLGQPFVDAPGKLLDNMLRAVGVQRLQPGTVSGVDAGAADAAPKRAYLTPVLKCRPALARAPSVDELATCSHYLRREIALTQPKVILAMGRFAMHLLLSETPPEQAKQPLGKLRGQVWRFAGVPVVVTYPPAYLLRSGQDKGKAWADLCLALDVVQGKSVT